MSDIDAISQIRYAEGVDPIEHAIHLVAIDLEVRDLARAGDLHPRLPLMLLDQSYDAYARRVVARLLDAGWTPPDVSAQRPEQAS